MLSKSNAPTVPRTKFAAAASPPADAAAYVASPRLRLALAGVASLATVAPTALAPMAAVNATSGFQRHTRSCRSRPTPMERNSSFSVVARACSSLRSLVVIELGSTKSDVRSEEAYDPPPSSFSGYPLRHLPKGPRPCPHVRARVHLPAATDLQLLLHGYNLQQADNDVRVMQGLTPRNVTECNEICQGARRRRRSGRVIDL